MNSFFSSIKIKFIKNFEKLTYPYKQWRGKTFRLELESRAKYNNVFFT